jgi:hypothetical protein
VPVGSGLKIKKQQQKQQQNMAVCAGGVNHSTIERCPLVAYVHVYMLRNGTH